MSHIWEHNPWYSICRPYTDFCTTQSYRAFEIHGKRSVPKDGAVIIAPNHCNTLMDAMVTAAFRRKPIVFGARADIFDNKTVAAILTFLRILPMVRRRDGIRKVLRNYETINSATDVLVNKVPFCIFSEGTHRAKHSLLPISKGIVRVALSAVERLEGQKPVYIIPTGLEYGDYFRYRSTVNITFGKPIDVTAFVKEHPDMGEAEVYATIRHMIHDGIAGLITYLPDDENYEGRWSLLKIKTTPLRGLPHARLQKTRKAAKEVLEAPGELLERAQKFDETRKAAGISMHVFGRHDLFGKSLAWIAILPFFLLSAVLTLPMWGTAEWLCRNKIKDKAFRNTARYGARLIGNILMSIIWAIVFFCCFKWYIALAGLIYFFFSFNVFYDYMEFSRRIISGWRLLRRKDLKSEFEAIRAEAGKI